MPDPAAKGRSDLVARQRALRALASQHAEEFDRVLDAERVKLGLPPRNQRPPIDAHEVAAMYRRMTLQEIADELGVSRETVRQALERLGAPRRPVGCRVAVSA